MRQVIRLPAPKVRLEVEPRRKAGADILRPYRGRYVGQEDVTVLFDADTPLEAATCLRQHGIDGLPCARRPDGRHPHTAMADRPSGR